MTEELNEIDEYGKCRNCGSRRTKYSTKQKGDYWVWEKICDSCNNLLERQILGLS